MLIYQSACFRAEKENYKVASQFSLRDNFFSVGWDVGGEGEGTLEVKKIPPRKVQNEGYFS